MKLYKSTYKRFYLSYILVSVGVLGFSLDALSAQQGGVEASEKSAKLSKKDMKKDKEAKKDEFVFTPQDREEIQKEEKVIIDSLNALSSASIKIEGGDSGKSDLKKGPGKEGDKDKKAKEGGKKLEKPKMPEPLEITRNSMSINLKELPGIAFVKIYNEYWWFLDGKYTLELPKNTPMGVIELEDCSTMQNSIFRLRLTPGYAPIITSEKQSWKVEFNTTVRMARSQKIVEFPKSIDDPVKILLPQFKNEISWVHPRTLIRFSLFTSKKQDGAFTPNTDYPQFKLIESYAGLGIQPKIDSIVAEKDFENVSLKGVTALSRPEFADEMDAVSILADNRSTKHINDELNEINYKTDSPEILYRKAILNARLGVINIAGICLNEIERAYPGKVPVEKSRFDILKLVIATLTPKSENAPLDISFANHTQSSPEYLFWYLLYKRIPQDYSLALRTFLKEYTTPLKNYIVEIILDLPDQHETLKELVALRGIDESLRARARLKEAMMAPVDLRELDELGRTSPNREVQGMATFEWVQEKVRLYEITPDQGIAKLEPCLLGFGPKTFDAKFLLCDFYIQTKKYTAAVKLYKDMLMEFPDRIEDLQSRIKEAYLDFFNDVMIISSGKEVPSFKPAPLEIIAFYNDFQHLTPDGEAGIKIILEVVKALKDLNLLKPAIELLNKTLELIKDPEKHKQLLFDLASLYIENRDSDGFDKAISSFPDNLSETEQSLKQELQVTSYISRNDIRKALDLIGDKDNVDSLKQKHRVYWVAKDYPKLMELLPKLIEKADSKEKPEYITHLAACNLLLPALVYTNQELRDRFQDLVKGSPFEDTFNALTTPAMDYRDGMKNFKDVEGLLKFVDKEVKGEAFKEEAKM